MLVAFTLRGHRFVALDGGPQFDLKTGGISFQIDCDSQQEVNLFCNKHGDGGPEYATVCGWLRYKYGVVWQIVSREQKTWLSDKENGGQGGQCHARDEEAGDRAA